MAMTDNRGVRVFLGVLQRYVLADFAFTLLPVLIFLVRRLMGAGSETVTGIDRDIYIAAIIFAGMFLTQIVQFQRLGPEGEIQVRDIFVRSGLLIVITVVVAFSSPPGTKGDAHTAAETPSSFAVFFCSMTAVLLLIAHAFRERSESRRQLMNHQAQLSDRECVRYCRDEIDDAAQLIETASNRIAAITTRQIMLSADGGDPLAKSGRDRNLQEAINRLNESISSFQKSPMATQSLSSIFSTANTGPSHKSMRWIWVLAIVVVAIILASIYFSSSGSSTKAEADSKQVEKVKK